MFGAGIGYLNEILANTSCEVISIHNEYNPSFGNIRPEPIEENLKDFIKEARKNKADLGLATDGDADRIGVIGKNCKFIDAQHLMSLLALHLIKNRGWKGGIVRTNSVTFCLRKIANVFDLPLYETPIGFKHVAELMLKHDILIGGEESGGMSFKNYIPERDGILAALLVIEMICMTKKPIDELIEEMEKEFGVFRFKRLDVSIEQDKKQKVLNLLNNFTPENILGETVKEITKYDGIKFIFKDDSWLLIRASGTEPILRIYAESSSEKRTSSMIDYAVNLTRREKC